VGLLLRGGRGRGGEVKRGKGGGSEGRMKEREGGTYPTYDFFVPDHIQGGPKKLSHYQMTKNRIKSY